MELYRLEHPEPTPIAAPEKLHSRGRDVEQVLRAHEDVDRRLPAYELDAAKVIDFPAMTDVRDPLTIAFLSARREADALRPDDPSSVSTEELSAYRSAVTSYDVAFQVAETEARRIRRSGFSASERQVAYRRARREPDGLIVLPEATVTSLEEKVAGALGSRPGPTSSWPRGASLPPVARCGHDRSHRHLRGGGHPAGGKQHDDDHHVSQLQGHGAGRHGVLPIGLRWRAAAGHHLSISDDDEQELRGYWDALAGSGTVVEPLVPSPWGDIFGMCRDRFSIDWMVNITATATTTAEAASVAPATPSSPPVDTPGVATGT